MKTDLNITEMAGWVATLEEFNVGQFRRKYGLYPIESGKIIKLFEKVGIVSEVRGQKAKQITTVPRQVLVKDISKAKQLITEYINNIEVNGPEEIKPQNGKNK